MVLPMTLCERPKRRAQSPSLMTATGPAPGRVVGGGDGSTEDGGNPELLIVITGDEFTTEDLGAAVNCGVEAAEALEGEEILEGVIPFAQLLIDGVGEGSCGIRPWASLPNSPQKHEATLFSSTLAVKRRSSSA